MALETSKGAPLNRQDLQDLGADFKSYFNTLIAQKLSPILQQLSDLTATLKEVLSAAKMEMEISLAVQDNTKRLQRSEWQL